MIRAVLPAPVPTSAGGGPALTFTWRDVAREICTAPTLAGLWHGVPGSGSARG